MVRPVRPRRARARRGRATRRSTTEVVGAGRASTSARARCTASPRSRTRRSSRSRRPQLDDVVRLEDRYGRAAGDAASRNLDTLVLRFRRGGADRRRGGRADAAGRRACCATSSGTGLVVPRRTRGRLPRSTASRELNQLRSLRELRRRFGVELDDIAFAARLRREPELRAAVETAGSPARTPTAPAGSSGSSESTSGCSPPDTETREGTDGNDEALRREGPRARRRRACGGSSGPTGRCRCSPRSASASSASSRSRATASRRACT